MNEGNEAERGADKCGESWRGENHYFVVTILNQIKQESTMYVQRKSFDSEENTFKVLKYLPKLLIGCKRKNNNNKCCIVEKLSNTLDK